VSRAILSCLVEELNAMVLVGSKGTNLQGDVRGDGAVCVFCRGVGHSMWETARGQGRRQRGLDWLTEQIRAET